MNPADRRIIHMTLQGMEGVATESRGEARTRRIVVMPA
jgi:predicted RNA-binding protein Jag